MGVFSVRVLLFPMDAPSETRGVDMVVDTGATYSLVPRNLLRDLRVRPERRRRFTLANGRTVVRELGWVGVEYGGDRTYSLVIFGEPGDAPLLGAFALEGLGLEVDPNRGVLRPARLWLLAAS